MMIRADQIQAFEEPMLGQFEQRMVVHVRSRFSASLADEPDEKVLARVRAGIERANGYGITLEYDVRRFLEYDVQFGPGFDRLDWAWPTLVPPGNGTEKMDILDAIVTFNLRS